MEKKQEKCYSAHWEGIQYLPLNDTILETWSLSFCIWNSEDLSVWLGNTVLLTNWLALSSHSCSMSQFTWKITNIQLRETKLWNCCLLSLKPVYIFYPGDGLNYFTFFFSPLVTCQLNCHRCRLSGALKFKSSDTKIVNWDIIRQF